MNRKEEASKLLQAAMQRRMEQRAAERKANEERKAK